MENTNEVLKVTAFPVLGINNTKQTMRCFPKSAPSLCLAEWSVARASPTSLCPWTAPSPSAAAASTSPSSTAQRQAFPATPVSPCWPCSSFFARNSMGIASVLCPGYGVCAALATDVDFRPWGRMRSGKEDSTFCTGGFGTMPLFSPGPVKEFKSLNASDRCLRRQMSEDRQYGSTLFAVCHF